MQFPKANSFSQDIVLSKIMGPNPLKLCEEMLLTANEIVGSEAVSSSSVVLDLGSGTGITTALLAREFGCVAYAADLWSNPTENMRFFRNPRIDQLPNRSHQSRCFGRTAFCGRFLRYGGEY